MSIYTPTATIKVLLEQQLPPLTEEEAEALRRSDVQKQLQPDVNIGMIGHVAHGKTSLSRAISGIVTTKFSGEKIRNITIKLGYANFKIFKCTNMLCLPPTCFQAFSGKTTNPKCNECESSMVLSRHISLVDCPGHEVLMRTMLNGASVMDSAILLVAANAAVPQPQTAEHLVVAEIMGLKSIITVQSKCDLVQKEEALRCKEDISEFLRGTIADKSPIIPMSCATQFKCNIDVLLQYLVERVPYPPRDLTAPPLMRIIRSFDINKPGTPLANVKGGVCGGTLQRGAVRVGEMVEIRPGIVRADKETGKLTVTPLFSKIITLFSETTPIQTALPGGLVAVGLKLDPSLTRQDKLVGQILGRIGQLPDVFSALEIQYELMRRLVGQDNNQAKISRLEEGEAVFLTIGSMSVPGTTLANKNKKQKEKRNKKEKEKEKEKEKVVRVSLQLPVCAELGDKISISRKVNDRWRLIGWGRIVAAQRLTVASFDE